MALNIMDTNSQTIDLNLSQTFHGIRRNPNICPLPQANHFIARHFSSAKKKKAQSRQSAVGLSKKTDAKKKSNQKITVFTKSVLDP
jgi:hypothetical protein